jgi:hypothetical protein
LSPSSAYVPLVGWTRHHRVTSQRHLFAPPRTDEVASAVNLGGVFYFHRSADVLSSGDTRPERIDDDSVSSRTMAVVTQ